MSTHNRTGRPEQVSAPAMREVIKMIDMAIENGSLDPKDRDEVIKMFFSDPKLVLDNKAGGGMMNINDMITPISMRNGGDPIQERISMLRESMRDDEAQTMRGANITGVAFRIAQDQGDTSEENIRLITNQLMALVPSLMKTVADETTPLFSKGVTSLLDKAKVLFGLKSDPKLRRDVGFSRVD
ncbi:cytochrome P450 [bacterium]|nr:cytochrome P450 [bacterium]